MINKINIKNLTFADIINYFCDKGYPKYRAEQLFQWVYKDIEDFDQIKNMPKNMIEMLNNDFYIDRAVIERKQKSQYDGTAKYLLKFNDGNAVEAVLMHYEHGRSICISTQVGCRMNCTFCASTIGGLVRNLTCGEMLEEVMVVERDETAKISNIVLMGSGEPFDNYDEVIKFIRIINDSKGMNIGTRHITISTCGVVPKIYDFIKEKLQCTLAISLHSAEDQRRSEIMPVNKKYSISEVIVACKQYTEETKRRVTFEYALIKDINDAKEDAHKLGNLLKSMRCHVNLIPVNSVEGKTYLKSERNTINDFKETLERYGIETTIRRELGSDIDAACGQLRQKYIEQIN